MDNLLHKKIVEAFEIYKDTVFMVDVDLRFWQSFMKFSIKEYLAKTSRTDDIFQAVFYVYNIDVKKNKGLLKTMKTHYSRTTLDLENQSKDFFIWVMILSMLKYYNALEIFLLQSIHMRYFPTQKNPIQSKKAIDVVHNEIKKYLVNSNHKPDLKNNRHIIDFLKIKSPEIKSFLELSVRFDLTTNWENFFEMISIFRNIVAHHGTIITSDAYNEIKSKADDIFTRYFDVFNDKASNNNLKPKRDHFLTLLGFYNNFTLNIVKFLFNQPDFTFLSIT